MTSYWDDPDNRAKDIAELDEWYARVNLYITPEDDMVFLMNILMMKGDALGTVVGALTGQPTEYESLRNEVVQVLDRATARADQNVIDDGRRFWYFSFADAHQFHHGCIIEADTEDEAYVRCHELELDGDICVEPAIVGPVDWPALFAIGGEAVLERKLTKQDIDNMPGGGTIAQYEGR